MPFTNPVTVSVTAVDDPPVVVNSIADLNATEDDPDYTIDLTGNITVPAAGSTSSAFTISDVTNLKINGNGYSIGPRYFHYLHHRYFECNYSGDGTVPLDKWFGTWHDGTTEGHTVMRERRRRAHGS